MDFVFNALNMIGKTSFDMLSLAFCRNSEYRANSQEFPLYVTVQEGDVEKLKQLHNLGGNIHYVDKYNGSLIEFATHFNNYDVIKYLIEQGVEVNTPNPSDGKSPLQIASLHGNVKISKLLVDNIADLNLQYLDSTAALVHAMRRGFVDIVKLLISRGLDFKSYFDYIKKDNHLLKHSERSEIKDYLLSLDEEIINVDNVDENGRTLLHHKVLYNKLCIEYDLDAGVDVNIRDTVGYLAIDYEPRYLITLNDEHRGRKFKQHIVKLITAGLPVCEENRQAVEEIPDNFKVQCQEEIEKTIINKVGVSEITFFDVLTNTSVHRLSIRLKFAGLDAVINDQKLLSEYPLYGGMLFHKLSKVKRRIKYVEEIENRVEGILCQSGLPYNFVREVWSYFTNIELKKVVLQKNDPIDKFV